MGKRKSSTNKSKSSNTSVGDSAPATTPAVENVDPDETLYAVVEFHHMLIGHSHKKEAAALSAASACGIQGFIFMGGPSAAVVEATKADLLEWLGDCKKAGKEGTVACWKRKQGTSPPINSKLKVVPYGSAKDTKMDVQAYKDQLAAVDIPSPLPSCPLLL